MEHLRQCCKSAYVNDKHDDWDKYLPYVMMAYRSAEHETTGY